MIDVADDGPGVPLPDRQRIFDKFAQGSGMDRRGAGLGLTFCKMVVELHGGTLVVEESHLGGALFRLSLPLTILSETETAAAPEFTEQEWTLGTS